MSVIFYCVAGEGMGHATRSEVVINELLKKNKIVIFSYDRAYEYLKKRFKVKVLDIVEIIGLNFTYEDNEFKVGKSIINERKKFDKLITKNFPKYLKYIAKYDPFLIITDYEPVSGTLARFLKIPLITIDNMNFFTKGVIQKEFEKNWQVKFTRSIVGLKGDYNFIVSLFKIPLRKKFASNTSFIGPLLRKEIINTKPKKKDHILVYQTSKSNISMFKILKSTHQKYIVYGFNKEKKEEKIIFKKPSVKGFAKDLASSKGIITNGGFSLICEAIYLNKPIYSIPVKNQIEQILNAYYLKKAGIAASSEEINIIDLNKFLRNLDEYEYNIKKLNIKYNELEVINEKVRKFSKYPTSKRTKMLKNIDKVEENIKQKLNKILK